MPSQGHEKYFVHLKRKFVSLFCFLWFIWKGNFTRIPGLSKLTRNELYDAFPNLEYVTNDFGNIRGCDVMKIT